MCSGIQLIGKTTFYVFSSWVIFSYAWATKCISANCYSYYIKYQTELGKCLLLKFTQIVAILLQDTLSVKYINWILSAPLVRSCSKLLCLQHWALYLRVVATNVLFSNIYIITEKSPLSILSLLRVINLARLKQRFDGFFFASFISSVQFFHYSQFILPKFIQITLYNCR